MKIRYLIFLFLVSSAVIPSDAFGQLFPNFSFSSSTQGEPQNDGLVHTETVNSFNVFNPLSHTGTFQTHPDYLLDYTNYKGQQVFIPYNIDENDGYVNFESAHNSVTFYKNTCSVRVFNGEHILGDSVPLISSASFDLQYAKNGTDTWIEHPANFQACTITHTISGNVITFDLVQSTSGDVTKDVQFIFNLEKQTSEVIPKVTNNNFSNLDTKYGWAIGLNGIKQIDLQGETVTQPITLIQNNNQNDLISIQGTTTTITIDPQNNVNHYLWATKISPDGIILDYKNAKNALPPGQTLAIDPSWTSGSGTSQGVRSTTGTTSCATASSKSSGDARVITPPTGDTANYCDLDTERWSITGFNKQWTATGITFQTNIAFSSGRDKTCAIMKETNDPNTASAATLQADIMSGSSYATSQNFCEQPNGGPFSSTLGGTSVSDFNSQTSLGWYAVGIKFDDQTKDHAHTDEADFTSTTLVVTYSWNPPAPITDTSCSDNAINSISCSWSVPASPTTILGYYETLNNTLHAPLFTNHLTHLYSFDYNDPVSGIIDYGKYSNNGTITGSFVNQTGIIGSSMNFTSGTYVSASNSNLPYGTSDRTFSFWIYPRTFSTYQGIMSYGRFSTGMDGVLLQIQSTTGKLVFDAYGSGAVSTNPLSLNTWNHVVWVLSSSGTIRTVYINGVLDSATSSSAINTISSNSLLLGKDATGDSCSCKIDNFEIYDKALVKSEITNIFNYRIISTNSFTNTVVKYPFTYNINVQGVSYNGMINQYLGNTVQIAPYNVIDPPYQAKATLGSDGTGFFENLTFAKPKVANSICGSLCTPNGYKIQHYNTTTHVYDTDSANQTTLFYVLRHLNQNTTQNIRLFTNNHAGLSARTFPLNQTTYPQEVSHWMLQNNLIDTRNLNNGTLTGNWNFTSGRNGNAQVMDGSTYDVMGSSSIPVGTSDRTIITWIYPTAFTSNSNAYFSYGTASANAQFSLIDANGKIDCGGAGNNVNSTTTLTVNKWNMVSCVLSNTGQTRQIYLNATLDKSSTTTALNTASSANTYIGTRVDSTSHAVTSLIGDTRIFSSALTSQQITNIYNEAIASRQNFAGSLTLSKSVGGNDVALNGTITISGGFPTTNTLTKYNMKNGTTLLNNTNTSTSIGTVYHIPTVWEQGISLTTPSSFKQSVLITSTASGTQNLTSNVVTTNGSYVPSYSATSGILWNYTLNRPSPYTKTTVTVNESPVTFSLDCQIRTNIQAVINSTGTHYNQSNVVFYQQNASSHNYDNLYGSCNDIPTGKQLFTFVSYGHTGNYITSGIAIFDQLGGFLGAPSVLIFILAILSWGTGRNFPMVIVIAVSALGLMGAMGLLVLHQSLWAMIFVLAGLAIFGIRKFY